MAAKLKIDLIVDDKGTIKVQQFGKTVGRAATQGQNSFKKLGSALEGLKNSIGPAINLAAKLGSVFTGVVAYGAFKAIGAASDLQEVSSKFGVVFAGQEKQAEQWAKTLVESYAMSTREAKQYLSSIQDLLVPMGMAADKAGLMSHEIVKLAADLGSFNNLPTKQVMADIQSALVGNYETMKKYGVVVNATIVQEEALARGYAKTKDELTVAQKAQVAYQLIVEDSQAALGDMARTQDNYANQVKTLKARIEDLVAAVGVHLLPYGTAIVEMLTDWTKETQNIIDKDMPGHIEKTMKPLEFLLKSVALVSDAYRGWKMIWKELEIAWYTTVETILGVAINLLELPSKIGEFFGFKAATEDLKVLTNAQAIYTQKIIDAKIALIDLANETSYYNKAIKLINELNEKIDEHKQKIIENAQGQAETIANTTTASVESVRKQIGVTAEEIEAMEKRALDLNIENDKARREILEAFYEDYRESELSNFELEKQTLDERYLAYEQYVTDKQMLNDWYAAEESRIRINQFMEESKLLGTLAKTWGLTHDEIRKGSVNAWKDVSKALAGASKQLASYFTEVITGSMTAKEAIKAFGEYLLKTVIETLIQIGIQELILAATGASIRAAETAATTASMAAVYAAAAPAAHELAMATFGASAVAGTAAYLAGLASMSAASLASAATFNAMATGGAAAGVPTYDEGGISTIPGIYYAGVPEAHIPLNKSGSVPVEISGINDTPQEIHIHSNIALELDGETLSNFIIDQVYERTKDGDQAVHVRGITNI